MANRYDFTGPLRTTDRVNGIFLSDIENLLRINPGYMIPDVVFSAAYENEIRHVMENALSGYRHGSFDPSNNLFIAEQLIAEARDEGHHINLSFYQQALREVELIANQTEWGAKSLSNYRARKKTLNDQLKA